MSNQDKYLAMASKDEYPAEWHVNEYIREIAQARSEGRSYVALAHALNIYIDMWIDEVEASLPRKE